MMYTRALLPFLIFLSALPASLQSTIRLSQAPKSPPKSLPKKQQHTDSAQYKHAEKINSFFHKLHTDTQKNLTLWKKRDLYFLRNIEKLPSIDHVVLNNNIFIKITPNLFLKLQENKDLNAQELIERLEKKHSLIEQGIKKARISELERLRSSLAFLILCREFQK